MRKTDQNYSDIEPAKQNAADIRTFLEKTLNISEIIETADASASQLELDYRKIYDLTRYFHKAKNERLFVFIYYSGHGAM